MESIYRRPLPDDLIAFASDEGRAVFRAALTAGEMDGFFALAEQFHTQTDPAFCGLGSLVMVLNALAIDPGRLWKGPWRWFSEELLDCCKPLDRVRENGLSMNELACLGRCNGADARVERASIDELRADLRAARGSASVVVASYSRRLLGQTGEGHFSPIGGYHEASDLALLLDVARFKYPPHWVPLMRLHAAMQAVDPESGDRRGWIVFARRMTAATILFSISSTTGIDTLVRALTSDLPAGLGHATDVRAALASFAAAIDTAGVVLATRETAAAEHIAAAAAVREALRATETYALTSSEAAAALALAAPDATWLALPADVHASLTALFARDRADEPLAAETRRLREQVEAITQFLARGC
jgi:glutathione gamma-glutamylcysteinyltransferase